MNGLHLKPVSIESDAIKPVSLSADKTVNCSGNGEADCHPVHQQPHCVSTVGQSPYQATGRHTMHMLDCSERSVLHSHPPQR